jgi:diacylglycerol kinase (ATP)
VKPIKLIYNPSASRGRAARLREDILEHFKNRGLPVQMELTERPDHARELARRAVNQGFTRIVVAGGDGTLNEVINGLLPLDGSVQLGVIPIGTCNDFIKSVDIPPDIPGAVDVIAGGNVKSVDVVRLGDRYFVNAAGIGFDVHVVKTIKKSSRRHTYLRYLLIVIKSLLRYKGQDIVIQSQGYHHRVRVLMFVVANGHHYGGGFHIAPGADATDGHLDVIVIPALSALKRIPIFLNVLLGRHKTMNDLDVFQCRELTLRAEQNMTFQLEGELYTWNEPSIEINICKEKLTVYSGS